MLPNSIKSALAALARAASRGGSAITAKAGGCCSTGACRIRRDGRRWSRSTARSPAADFASRAPGRGCSLDAATLLGGASTQGTGCSRGALTGPSRPAPSTARPSAGRPAHYAELARALHAPTARRSLLLGSPGEAALCDEIADAAPGACRVLAGKTSLLDAMALIAASRGLVSNDSGLMHVAAAFGVPQVAVFGSTSPLHTPPLNRRARVLWLKDELQLDCMPCFDRTCRFGHYRCLTEVAPERVAGGAARRRG